MLAGKMKLTNFLALATGGGALLAGGLGLWLSSRPEAPPEPVVTTVPEVRVQEATVQEATVQEATVQEATVPEATETAADNTSAPAHHADVLRWVGQDLGTTKKKDVSKGKTYKINVYQDEGSSTANRAKVDLDRDDKWDEKWTFHEEGHSSRKVAPADDEDYTETWVWNGSAWTMDE